jgi:hypothetical protein
MDFEIGFESFQRNTSDRFQYTPVTFLPKKIQSKWFQIKNHEFMLMNQKRGEKGGKGRKDSNQNQQAHERITGTKKNLYSWQIHEVIIYTKNYKFKCSSQLETREKGVRKKEERGAAAFPIKLAILMTQDLP